MSLAPILLALQQPEARVAMEVDVTLLDERTAPAGDESGDLRVAPPAHPTAPWVVVLLAAAAVVTVRFLWSH